MESDEPFILPRPEDQITLSSNQPARAEGIQVALLSKQGEQVPPGKYQVRAFYSNDIRPVGIQVLGGPSMDVSDPGQFWQGRIESLPCSLNVLPAQAESVTIEVSTQLLPDMTSMPGQFGWSFAKDSMKTVRVLVRPGFTVGNRWKFPAVGTNEPRGWSSSNSWPTHARMFLLPEQTSLVSVKGAELLLDLEIFETSRRIESRSRVVSGTGGFQGSVDGPNTPNDQRTREPRRRCSLG
jgi:hypothetical protein